MHTSTPQDAVSEEIAASGTIRDDGYSKDDMNVAREKGAEVAYLLVARAWIDRWKALGGTFDLSFDKEGKVASLHRGMWVDPDYWKPSDSERDDLPPHVKLLIERHHEGAVKALEGLHEMLPDLQKAIKELAAQEVWQRYAGRGV